MIMIHILDNLYLMLMNIFNKYLETIQIDKYLYSIIIFVMLNLINLRYDIQFFKLFDDIMHQCHMSFVCIQHHQQIYLPF